MATASCDIGRRRFSATVHGRRRGRTHLRSLAWAMVFPYSQGPAYHKSICYIPLVVLAGLIQPGPVVQQVHARYDVRVIGRSGDVEASVDGGIAVNLPVLPSRCHFALGLMQPIPELAS